MCCESGLVLLGLAEVPLVVYRVAQFGVGGVVVGLDFGFSALTRFIFGDCYKAYW